MSGWRADLCFAARMLLQRPGFTLVAVLTLALGTGGNAAMFGVINATVLTPLPYPSPERLLRIWETTPEGHRFSASEPNFLDLRERSRSFATLAAGKDVSLTLQGDGDPRRVDGMAVSQDFFTTLGVQPRLGRGFTADEDAPGSDGAAVVLGDGLWRQQFAADPQVLGRRIELDGRAHVVVGVMPAGFDFAGAALWPPLAADPAGDRGDHWLAMIGRLADGVSPAQAEAELAGIAEQIDQAHPAVAGWSIQVMNFPRSSRWKSGAGCARRVDRRGR